MLNELSGLQESDESLWSIEMSFDIETRCEEENEIVHKEYKFSYAKEWDKWMFVEFNEKRTPAHEAVGDRNWRKSRHIMWNDVEETRTIDVPSEVSEALEEATGSDSVTIQVPSSMNYESTE